MDTIIRDATLISMDAAHADRPFRADIRISGTKIAEIGPDLPHGPGDCVIDGRDRLVIPGLVNAHAHSGETLLKGRYHNLPLDLWIFAAYPLFGAEPLAERLIYLRSMLSAIESLKNGVTCIVDDIFEPPAQTLETLAPVFRAYDESGIRASVAGHIINRPLGECIPFLDEYLPEDVRADLDGFTPPTAEQYLGFAREAIARFHQPEGRLRFVLSPSGPQRCTHDLLVGAHDLAREIGTLFHIHVLESKSQVVAGEMDGRSLVRLMDDLGILSDHSALAHSIWINDDDIALMADRGASAIHNPISNQKLGSGIMPWRKLHAAGVNVALGADGTSTNDTPRMFDVLRSAAILHNLSTPDYSQWPSVHEVLRAATMGGARAAQLHREIGSLEVGKRADLVLLDTNSLNFTPLNDLRHQLIHCENGTSVRMVLVDGEVVVEDGRLTRVNEDDILGELRAAMPAFRENHDRLEKLNARLRPALEASYCRCMRHETALNRFSTPPGEWWQL